MKQITTFQTENGQAYELIFTIKGLMNLEREIHQSLFSVVNSVAGGNLRELTLAFTIAALRNALTKPKTTEEVEQLIADHCTAGGSLDDVNKVILEAIFATGLFTPGKPNQMEEKP